MHEILHIFTLHYNTGYQLSSSKRHPNPANSLSQPLPKSRRPTQFLFTFSILTHTG